MQFPPHPCHLVSFWSKYSAENVVLKEPHFMFFHNNYDSRTEDKPTSETDDEQNYAVPEW